MKITVHSQRYRFLQSWFSLPLIYINWDVLLLDIYKVASALWWTDYVMNTLFLSHLRFFCSNQFTNQMEYLQIQ